MPERAARGWRIANWVVASWSRFGLGVPKVARGPASFGETGEEIGAASESPL